MSEQDEQSREAARAARERALRDEVEKQKLQREAAAQLGDDSKPEPSGKLKTLGAAAGGFAAGAAVSGARSVRATASGGFFWLMFVIAMIVFFVDWNANFFRSGPYSATMGSLWMLVGVGGYYLLRSQGLGQKEAIRAAVVRTVWSFFLPLLLAFFAQQISQNGAAIPSAGQTFGVLLLGVWTPLVLMYFGWPHFFMASAGERTTIFRLVDGFVILLVLAGIFVPIFGTMAMFSESSGVSTASLAPVPKFAALGQLSWDATKNWYGHLKTGVTGEAEDKWALWRNATQPHYVGQVERSQGKPLGVTFKDLQALQPVFNYRFDGDPSVSETLIPAVGTATFFGTVQARTLSEDIPVNLRCYYQVSDPKDLRNFTNHPGRIRPDKLFIHYTGEFVDEYPFECSFDMEKLPHDTPTDLNGRFFVEADFPFDTWGYTTLTFMDRDVMTALRREGTDPARSLGIESRPTARYTPGPVSLGMETVPQPIGVDLQRPTTNFLPAFGITIENAWYSQGEVDMIDQLILQVPEPLQVDDDACLGIGDTDSYQFHPYEGIEQETVPEGYVWYVFDDIRFGEDTYKSVRCPLTVDTRTQSWQGLLGPDLSPRQYTLVARARYNYTMRAPVAMRLGVERFT